LQSAEIIEHGKCHCQDDVLVGEKLLHRLKVKGCKGEKVKGWKGERVKGWKGEKVKG